MTPSISTIVYLEVSIYLLIILEITNIIFYLFGKEQLQYFSLLPEGSQIYNQ